MKNICKLFTFFLVSTILTPSCDSISDPNNEDKYGNADLHITLNEPGRLTKSFEIELDTLFIQFKKDGSIINDTLQLSGNYETVVNKNYHLLHGDWIVKVESRDINDVIIHSDSTTFSIEYGTTVDVSLSLVSKYSTLFAVFDAIEDSVTRCELLVDSVKVADSSFAAQSDIGSILTLNYDYLTAGEDHNIKLDVYGSVVGTEYLLYTGDTTITVVAGEDQTYTVNLVWVGPTNLMSGVLAVQITLGASSTVSVNGIIPSAPMMDQDGNMYKTIKIGNQVWMAENLRVTTFRDGSDIPYVSEISSWANSGGSEYSFYGQDSSNISKFGNLYNWYVLIDTKQISPIGWHVPTDDEWKELEIALGMGSVEADNENSRGVNVGAKLAGGYDYWPNSSGSIRDNNYFGESGFDALPGGVVNYTIKGFSEGGNKAMFWTRTNLDDTYSWFRNIEYGNSKVERNVMDKRFGLSVRLVRDK